eukprot:TRINITY_DN570_c0_g1_i2.p1 TRINITY_DN570_c0_g1~~TRINITY_DN570_c0_g1_i2.p1  ORF type:complete len:125 (+),score=13.65 TRINITY_DN570_c0_g1_i2:49-423(+)
MATRIFSRLGVVAIRRARFASSEGEAKSETKAAPKVSSSTPKRDVKPATCDMEFLNIYKNGTPVTVMPDYKYPGWVWELALPPRTLADLLAQPYESLTDRERKRLFKLQRKISIKKTNKASVVK